MTLETIEHFYPFPWGFTCPQSKFQAVPSCKSLTGFSFFRRVYSFLLLFFSGPQLHALDRSGTAGPEPQVLDRSGRRQTSSAPSQWTPQVFDRSQWAPPDRNRQCSIAVGTVGPQPPVLHRSGHRQARPHRSIPAGPAGRMPAVTPDTTQECVPDRMQDEHCL